MGFSGFVRRVRHSSETRFATGAIGKLECFGAHSGTLAHLLRQVRKFDTLIDHHSVLPKLEVSDLVRKAREWRAVAVNR
jgi:hypothetical protein